MALHKVTVIQYFKARREITVEVEAQDPESAVESVQSGDTDVPSFDDPGWKTGWDLQNEQVTHAV